MLNIYNLNFTKVAVHIITPKIEGAASANVVANRRLIELSEEVNELIKERLYDALKKTQKTFELVIEDNLTTSFFGICKDTEEDGDNIFLDNSIRLANKLAENQTSENIPGGYFIFIKAKDSNQDRNVFITLKADITQALSYDFDKIKILNNLFLTKSTKFFKFCLLYNRLEQDYQDDYTELEYPNDKYCCVLFDEQFRPDSIPAEYFYKGFLGLSIEYNAKIQSKRFYEFTEKFFKSNVESYDEMNNMLKVLKIEMEDNNVLTFQPAEFGQKYIQNQNYIETYNKEVITKLPDSISKDNTLIKSKLKSQKIEFPNRISISGPEESLTANFEIINDKDELLNLNPNQESYTIIKIKGRPFKI